MPTTNDDAPAPRARRPLGRGPGTGPAAAADEPPAPPDSGDGSSAAPHLPGPPAAPTVTSEPSDAADPPDIADPPDMAEIPGLAAPSDAFEAPDATESPDTGETSDTSGTIDTSGTSDASGVDDGRFTVRLDNFEGPFDLLLQLISRHKMDVTEVALSKVTDEFMAHIRAMGPDWDLDQTTEFLVVAATLLDLKAARLLPAAEVEDEADLALLEARDLLFARLLQYRAYKRIADIFSGRLADEARRYPRTVGLEPEHAELLPEVVISIGAEGFARLAVKAMRPKARPQVYVDHIHAPLVSVREQAEVVMAQLRAVGTAGFQELVADAPDTLTVVARFLALLELYRERVVALDQEEALGALTVRWTGAEGAEPVVTDEFDQETQPPADARESEETE
ncbi:segregation and condensation protein A [Streptomyces sp. NPDC048650]|uniref:segregation and condensation protein A n=1 Tax=Streptomyces sp. NPDC048650 TaxID=3365583 RepID=UPI003716A9F4